MYLRIHDVNVMPSHVAGIASASEALGPDGSRLIMHNLPGFCLSDQPEKQANQEQGKYGKHMKSI